MGVIAWAERSWPPGQPPEPGTPAQHGRGPGDRPGEEPMTVPVPKPESKQDPR